MTAVQVFFSRVTEEFGSYDQAMSNMLRSVPGGVVKTPSDIADYASGSGTLEKLWEFVRLSDAVVHLVGRQQGAKPRHSALMSFLASQPELRGWLEQENLHFEDWSYTQWEGVFSAFQRSKFATPNLVFVCLAHGVDAERLTARGIDAGLATAIDHLAAMRTLGTYPEIRGFDNEAQLVGRLWASALGTRIHRPRQDDLMPIASLMPALRKAPAIQSLTHWPQVAGESDKARWLDRPELRDLVERIDQEPNSVTLLLGEPGSGKSALLARLANLVSAKSVAVIPIKVDMIDEGVRDSTSLALDLGLPAGVDLAASVRRLAGGGSVVVVLDQLDALAKLVVQSAARLRVFHQLICDLTDHPNVHIVASCRTFEQLHDPLLRTISAETIELQLPCWDDVETVLALNGLTAGNWSTQLKETLRNPQALALFLQIRALDDSAPALASYQDMLDELWDRRVVKNPNGNLESVASSLAAQMAAKESIWLASAVVDADGIDRLVAANVLRREGRKVGFSHQTLFEHTRARAFARAPKDLVEAVKRQQHLLRIRPQIWHALTYLRGVDVGAYHSALSDLWDWQELRPHLRMLLIEFMGSRTNPDDQESRLLHRALADQALTRKVLVAVIGSGGWFERLRHALLPRLMVEEGGPQHEIRQILMAAFRFNQGVAVELIRTCWLPAPSKNHLIWTTLGQVVDWTDGVLDALETVLARDDYHARTVDDMASTISAVSPAAAPRLLRSWLDRQTELDGAAEVSREKTPDGDAAELYATLGKSREALSRAELYCAGAVASAAPSAFVTAIWPWFASTVQRVSYVNGQIINAYFSSSVIDFDFDSDDDRMAGGELLQALDLALSNWADQDPPAFLALLDQNVEVNSALLHRLLSRALRPIVDRHPEHALRYLCGDARRLSLGPQYKNYADSWRLVSALYPRLDLAQRQQLDETITAWTPYNDVPEEDVATSTARNRWRREHRLLLLRAVPEGCRSATLLQMISAEERELPDVRPDEPERGFGVIGSPISAAQMGGLSDAELSMAIRELPDQTGWSHPGKFMQGGAIQLARELAKLAGVDSDRAIKLITQLPADQHAIAAGTVLTAIAKSAPADQVYAFAEQLLDLGFSRDLGFRRDLAVAMTSTMSTEAPLSARLFDQMEAWLEPHSGPWDKSSRAEETRADSRLWSQGSVRFLPAGNRPFLDALGKASRTATPPLWDRWLTILEQHVERDEDPAVWASLLHELQFLGHADRLRAAAFMGQLLERHAGILPRQETALLIAENMRWASSERALSWLRVLMRSAEPGAVQSAGELLLLLYFWRPADSALASLVDALRTDSGIAAVTAFPTHLRVGMAHTAAKFWPTVAHRQLAAAWWQALIAYDETDVRIPLSAAFRTREEIEFPTDDVTAALLQSAIRHPAILKCPNASYLPEQLLRLIRLDWECALVGSATLALAQQVGSDLGNRATSWPFDSEPLTDIAQLLQSKPEKTVQLLGIELMEILLEHQSPIARETMEVLDNRMLSLPALWGPRRRRRLQKSSHATPQ